jgi:hypothetical protein
MVHASSVVGSGDLDLRDQLGETGSYLNADMNQDSFADLYSSPSIDFGESDHVSSFTSSTSETAVDMTENPIARLRKGGRGPPSSPMASNSENHVDMMENPMARFRNAGGEQPKIPVYQQSSPKSLPKPKR